MRIKVLGGEGICRHSELQLGLLLLDFGNQRRKQTCIGPDWVTAWNKVYYMVAPTHMNGTWDDSSCGSTELPWIKKELILLILEGAQHISFASRMFADYFAISWFNREKHKSGNRNKTSKKKIQQSEFCYNSSPLLDSLTIALVDREQ